MVGAQVCREILVAYVTPPKQFGRVRFFPHHLDRLPSLLIVSLSERAPLLAVLDIDLAVPTVWHPSSPSLILAAFHIPILPQIISQPTPISRVAFFLPFNTEHIVDPVPYQHKFALVRPRLYL